MRSVVLCVLLMMSLSLVNAQNKSESFYIEETNRLLEKREIKSAFEVLDFGINELDDPVKLYGMRGVLFEAMRKYDEAIHDFSKAIKLVQEDTLKSRLYSNRGGVKYKIRDFDGAYEDLKLSVDYDSTNLEGLSNFAMVCKAIGKTNESIEILERIVSMNPQFVTGYVNLGFAYQEIEEYEKSIAILNKAIELKSDNPLAYSNRSFAKLKLGKVNRALKDINKSIKLLPSNSYAYKIKALIEIEKGNIENACKDLNTSLKLGYTNQYGTEVKELLETHCN